MDTGELKKIKKEELSNLINGIEKDAKEEAESLLEKAKSYVEERKTSCNRKLEEIRRDTKERLAVQVTDIERNTESSISVEQRRISLKIRDQIIRDISGRVKKKLADLIGSSKYKDILVNWIAEAAMGLNPETATVNASAAEISLVDDGLLKKAAGLVKELSGKAIILVKSTESPLLLQGITVTSEDGKTAFNNQIHTRLLRYQSEIRKMIYDNLFKD